jgi:hypothetical protein
MNITLLHNPKSVLPPLPRATNLWEMISFLAREFICIYDELDYYHEHAQRVLKEYGPQTELESEVARTIEGSLWKLHPLCEKFALTNTNVLKTSILQQLYMFTVKGEKCFYASMATKLWDILQAMKADLKQKQLVFIPESKAQFHDQHDLFGEMVSCAFPSVQAELQDAGNCLVAELHTSAVFHLMRVAEHGLRALARHLRVKLKFPLEYAGWEEVIRTIDKKLDKIAAQPRGKKKTESLNFYRRTLDECEMLKDSWRNPVSHLRGRFTEAEALGVYSRVKEFMQRLSEKVKEIQ